MGNLLRTVPDDESSGAVTAAWGCGVRYFDVAPHYGLGLAEHRLGSRCRIGGGANSWSPPRSAASCVPSRTRLAGAMMRG
jgi:hypothetical protein